MSIVDTRKELWPKILSCWHMVILVFVSILQSIFIDLGDFENTGTCYKRNNQLQTWDKTKQIRQKLNVSNIFNMYCLWNMYLSRFCTNALPWLRDMLKIRSVITTLNWNNMILNCVKITSLTHRLWVSELHVV
jgi:hypothetical protein